MECFLQNQAILHILPRIIRYLDEESLFYLFQTELNPVIKRLKPNTFSNFELKENGALRVKWPVEPLKIARFFDLKSITCTTKYSPVSYLDEHALEKSADTLRYIKLKHYNIDLTGTYSRLEYLNVNRLLGNVNLPNLKVLRAATSHRILNKIKNLVHLSVRCSEPNDALFSDICANNPDLVSLYFSFVSTPTEDDKMRFEMDFEHEWDHDHDDLYSTRYYNHLERELWQFENSPWRFRSQTLDHALGLGRLECLKIKGDNILLEPESIILLSRTVNHITIMNYKGSFPREELPACYKLSFAPLQIRKHRCKHCRASGSIVDVQ